MQMCSNLSSQTYHQRLKRKTSIWMGIIEDVCVASSDRESNCDYEIKRNYVEFPEATSQKIQQKLFHSNQSSGNYISCTKSVSIYPHIGKFISLQETCIMVFWYYYIETCFCLIIIQSPWLPCCFLYSFNFGLLCIVAFNARQVICFTKLCNS